MADCEYKEATWENPISASLYDQKNGDCYLNQQGFGYVLKDGYPIETELKSLKNTEKKSFSSGMRESTIRNILPLKDGKKQIDDFNSKSMMDFTTWLGHHSRTGWEIFKISRNFSTRNTTWCIFRRKI